MHQSGPELIESNTWLEPPTTLSLNLIVLIWWYLLSEGSWRVLVISGHWLSRQGLDATNAADREPTDDRAQPHQAEVALEA